MIYGLGMQELLIILAIVMLLFGGKKLPEVGRNLGKAIRGFKESEEETLKELKREGKETKVEETAPSADVSTDLSAEADEAKVETDEAKAEASPSAPTFAEATADKKATGDEPEDKSEPETAETAEQIGEEKVGEGTGEEGADKPA